MDPELAALIRRQDGVVSRRQALAAGMTPVGVARQVRRRAWVLMHPGVYLEHNGPPTWRQRAWAAVLACSPAVLDGRSAVRVHEGTGRHDQQMMVIEVAVERGRHVVSPTGVRVRRVARLDDTALWHRHPPCRTYEAVIVDLADAAATDEQAVAWLAGACGSRRTTATRVLAVVQARARLRRRSLLADVLEDVAAGTHSVLEHGYRTRVERAHGLPISRLQVRVRGSGQAVAYRDAEYEDYGVVVELDGHLFHDSSEARDRDMERDLDAVVGGRVTVRLGYGQVMSRACGTAAKVGDLLRRRGWQGAVRRCPRCSGSDLRG